MTSLFAQTAAAQPGESPAPAADQMQLPVDIKEYVTTIRFENDGSGQREEAFRVLINTDDGARQMQELSFSHDATREQVALRFLRVERPDGTVENAASDAITEVPATQPGGTRSGGPETHIKAPALHPGDMLIYDLVKHVAAQHLPKGQSGEFWYEHDFLRGTPVQDERLTINVPAARAIILRSPDAHYAVTTKEGRKIYEWKRSSPTAVYNPPGEEHHDADVQLTSFASWRAVGRWYAALEHRAAAPSVKVQAKTREVTKGIRSQEQRVAALYDFVSTQIHTSRDAFGSNGYQPRAVDDILESASGSASEKHALFAAMLAVAGIPAETALLGNRKLNPALPSPLQFDHIVTVVPVQEGPALSSSLFWADTSLEVAPFGLLTARRRGAQALLIPPSGFARIVGTPADPPFRQTEIVEMEDTVSDLGKLTQIIRYHFRGDREVGFRFAFRRTPSEKWKGIAENMIRFDGLRGTVVNVKASDPANTRKPFEVEIELSQPSYLNWSAAKNAVHIPMPNVAMPGLPLKSTKPAILDSPLDKTIELKLTFPSGYTVRAPTGARAQRSYADYRSRYSVDGTVVTGAREVRLKQHEVAPSLAEDYQAFNQVIEKDESAEIVLERNTAAEIPASATPDELETAAEEALHARQAQNAVALLQRVLQLDPLHKDAYRSLGEAYAQLGQPDGAVDAFRKQLDKNPKDDRTWAELAVVLTEQQKLDDAADAYKKLLELHPQDANGHRMLGGIYLDQQKYRQAVPELQKAEALAPNNPLLELALGRAYLYSGKNSEALEAYAKAADHSATAQGRNTIAGDLLEKGIALDRAQQYAESAVQASNAELVQIDPAHIIQWQLSRVVQLGECWDTLGSIYLQRGMPEKAEPFLRASWDLLREGTTGYHLGRLYEKQEKKDLAAQTYARAALSSNPPKDISKRLAQAAGGDSKAAQLLEKIKADASATEPLYPLGKLAEADAQADFYVVLVPGEQEKPARVQDVGFIGGSEALKEFADRLRALDFGRVFPDTAPSKIIRRGTLTCSAKAGNCSFVFTLPQNVHSLQ